MKMELDAGDLIAGPDVDGCWGAESANGKGGGGIAVAVGYEAVAARSDVSNCEIAFFAGLDGKSGESSFKRTRTYMRAPESQRAGIA